MKNLNVLKASILVVILIIITYVILGFVDAAVDNHSNLKISENPVVERIDITKDLDLPYIPEIRIF